MLRFECDYNVGAHEKILQRFLQFNKTQFPAYGEDDISKGAKEKIKKAFDCPLADMFFLTGGTQTNMLVISTLLDESEGVISAQTGHINAHEAGAVEATGHKVLPIPHKNGKISACDVQAYIDGFYADGAYPHMVHPGMVYISHPTEYGTLYGKAELKALFETCKSNNIPLYLDGARLGYGLASDKTDLKPADIATYTNAFYIGGTKVGALFGEALVFPQGNAPKRFFTKIKNRGALLAKGWALGLQFDTLFTDDLYFKIGKNASDKANMLAELLQSKGFEFFLPHQTNQIFVIMDNEKMKELSKKAVFEFWEKYDENRSVCRFCTSWATTDSDIEELKTLL